MSQKTDLKIPADEQIEKSIISEFFSSKNSFMNFYPDLTVECFSNNGLQAIFNYMVKHQTNDVVVISARFPNLFNLIAECMEYAGAKDLCAQIDVLKDCAFRRKLLKTAAQIQEAAKSDYDSSAVEISDMAQKELYDVRMDTRRKPELIGDILPSFFAEMERQTKGIGLRTGLIDVDNTLGPLCPGELILLAARPSMGKSSLALDIVRHNSVYGDVPVLLFSLEMSKEMVSGRILFTQARANYQRALSGVKSEYMKVAPVVSEISDKKIHIDDTPAINIHRINSLSIAYKRSHNIGLVIVDHIHLMGVNKGRSRNEEIAEISAGLKNLARDLDIPVIALSQLSREVERRNPPEPNLSDLRDSGSLEQDSDKVIMLYRPEKYFPNDEAIRGKAWVIIAKNRNGETGRKEVLWDGEHMTFSSVSSREEEGSW